MVATASLHQYRLSDYLALEAASNTKHEFVNGEIYAMAGGTPEHAALAVAVSAALFAQLRGGPCRVYSSDLRIRVLATGLITYPDVTVVCGSLERDPESASTVTNPTLVVEVQSDSTAVYDRGEKLQHYRAIPALAAAILLSHREASIDVWERLPGGRWDSRTFGPGETASLETMPIRLVVDEIYLASREPQG